jgi:hypothetical protein
VREGCLGGTSRKGIRRLMRKRRRVKRTAGSRGQKNGAVKRFQDQVVAAEGRTLGSRGQKNGAVKRFQDQVVAAEGRTLGSRGQKNGAEKSFQDQAVHAEKRTKQKE